MNYDSVVAEVMKSIRWATKKLGHPPLVCVISDDEWRAIVSEHFGGPWFGSMTILGVRIALFPHSKIQWQSPAL